MGFSEDVDSWARNRSRHSFLCVCGTALALICCIDAAAIVLLGELGGERQWHPPALLNRLGDVRQDTIDLLLLFGRTLVTR